MMVRVNLKAAWNKFVGAECSSRARARAVSVALLVIIVLFIPVFVYGDVDALYVCRIGFFVCLIHAVLLSRYGILRPSFLIYATFVLFSFGVPILIAIKPEYSDHYLSLIDKRTFVRFAYYTIVCISAFGTALSLTSFESAGAKKKGGSALERLFIKVSGFLDENIKLVVAIAFFVFLLTGIVSFAYALEFTLASLKAGIVSARDTVVNTSLVNLCRGLFVPLFFFLLAFARSKKYKISISIVMLIYSSLSLLSGDRTEGLTLLVALFVYWYRFGSNGGTAVAFKRVVAAACCMLILFLIPAIASFRVGGGVAVGGILDTFEKVLSELGFNFYTVCFQSCLDLPRYYGLTYVASLSSLLPRSLDVLGIKNALHPMYGEVLYNEGMASVFDWVTFGLGYSVVAESYLNFAFAGFLIVFFIGVFVGRLCSRESDSNFGCYVAYSCLWAFFTLARRGFDFPINSLKYILIIVPAVLIVSVLAIKRFGRGLHQEASGDCDAGRD